MINFFGFIITIIYYKLAEFIRRIKFMSKIPPIVTSGVMLVLTLEIFKIDFNTYNESASYLTLMLIPATIALGYPIYKNIELLKRNKRVIYTAFVIAAIIGIVTTYIAARLCHSEFLVVESMLPKSVTAPIAVEISKGIGAIPEMKACVVALTGIFGGMFGHRILRMIKVKNDIAIGLSIGAASHVIGTARCIEENKYKQVVMASVSLVIVGIITAIMIPLFLELIK